MRQPTFYSAVYGIIRDLDNKILFIKRRNTGCFDGYYGFPAGHVEGTETLAESMQRELLEEIGIHTEISDLRMIHACHRIDRERIYFDFYFEIDKYTGTPTNAEPDKSEGIFWLDWKQEEKIQFREVIKKIEDKEPFSEINFRF